MAAFVVPFIFIYRPALLMMGSPLEIMLALIVGIAVIVCMASALEGQLLKKLNNFERLLLLVAALAFVAPILPLNLGLVG
jgi:TRAP-type uncharacterized transport system fused permease subunit